MKTYRITLDASYNYDTQEITASNMLHLISRVIEAYSINSITKIELLS